MSNRHKTLENYALDNRWAGRISSHKHLSRGRARTSRNEHNDAICARGIETRRAARRSNRGSEADRAWRQSLETPMSCCDETTARVPDTDVSRRALFKGAALVASVIPAARPTQSQAQGKEIKLAYCSQLLCGVPYEVARSAGYFKN